MRFSTIGYGGFLLGLLTSCLFLPYKPAIAQAPAAPAEVEEATTDSDDSGAAEVPTVVSPQDAKDHIGKKCVVEFKVESATLLKDKQICFLNSESNHRASSNFSAVIVGEPALKKFSEAKIPNPAEAFRGKSIRVTGVITMHRGSPQIKIESPDEIVMVEEANDKP